ncbi:hypothetical protein D917_04854 [Trichinella nativa]|uniref:Calponin-homology (CH) domain-containing protein n=1 Tax=Trichinella nativa TaxID=6335 RepID=A0A1Y3EYE4_9BILA|nr:hypothetical protein D917_04854 [Trichinella nativa]
MASYALYSPSQSPVRLELTHFSRIAILSFGTVTFGKTAQQSFLVVNNKQCDQQFFFDFSSVNRTDISVDNEAALVPAKGEIECVVKWKPTETGNFRLSLPLKVTMFPSDEDEYLDAPIRYWLRATLVGSCVLPQEILLKQKKVPLCIQRIPMTSAIKSNVKMGREFESEKLSARPNRIQANHNSQQSVRKDANFKHPFVEHVFTTFLNHLLTQDFITDDSNSEATQDMISNVSPKAAAQRRVSLKQYAAVQQLNLLRLSASKAFCEVRAVVYRVCQAVEKGKILVRREVAIHRDQGIKRLITNLLLSVHPLWLRIGLEVVYSEIIQLDGDCTVRGLINFIRFRMLSDPELLKQYGIAHVRSIYKNDYQPAISKFFLQKFLSLFIFLDFAKQKRLIKQDPCLFNPNSKYKEILSGEGNLFKTLAAVGYVPNYKQAWYDEKPLAIENLAVDLRDGLALTRLAAMFTENPGLVTNLRGPPISRLQKLHNVQLALDNFMSANINIGDVDAASIVGGDRDKIMALLWRLILHKLEFPDEVVQSPLMPEIISLRRSLRMKNSPEAKKMLNIKLHKKMTISELFICWLGCIAAHYGIEVDNLNLSLADGRVLCCTINYYLPSVLPIREIGHVPDFFEFDRLQNLEYTDERVWILCLNSLATVLFALRREQQAACIIQKAWKTYLRKNCQQAVEMHEYSNVDHYNEHLLVQNEQLKIEEKENFIVGEIPFDEKEQSETCAVAVVDENDKMESDDNLSMEIETLIEFQACCRRKLVLNNFLQQYKSDSGNEYERSDEEECAKELSNAQSDQNADAFDCMTRSEVVQQQNHAYGINVKSNSSLPDANECKVENSYAVHDAKDESSLFENNIINLNRNQSVIANESVCLLETNVAAHKQNELMEPTLDDQKPEFLSSSSFLSNLSDMQNALPAVDEVKSISLADIPRIVIEECRSPAETTASILSSTTSALKPSGSNGRGFAELDAVNEAECPAPFLLIEKLPKFSEMLEMFEFRPIEEKRYSPLNFDERQQPLYRSTKVLSLSTENFEGFSDDSGQNLAALLCSDGASSADVRRETNITVNSENLLNMQMSCNCNYGQTDQTEADLKPSNDETIAFNEPGNVGAGTDGTDLCMGPTELLFCSDRCDQNFIPLKTDKSVSLMEAVDNLKHLTEIPRESFPANQTSMNNMTEDCLSPPQFGSLTKTPQFDSTIVGENAAEVNVEFPNLTSAKSPQHQAEYTSLIAAFLQSDFKMMRESAVNFNERLEYSPIPSYLKSSKLYAKCTAPEFATEDSDATVQVEPTARSSECGSSPENAEKKLNNTESSNLSDKDSEDFVIKEVRDYFETPSLRSIRSAIEVDSKFQMTPYIAECERLANRNDSLSFNFLKFSSIDFETPIQNRLHNSSSNYSDILNASTRNIFEGIMSAEAKDKNKSNGIIRRIPSLKLQQNVMDSVIEQENCLDTELPVLQNDTLLHENTNSNVVTQHDEISNLLKTIVESDRLVCIENAVLRLNELSKESEDMCKRMVELDAAEKLLALVNRLNRSFNSSIIIDIVMKCLKQITSHQSTMKSVTESVDWFQSLAWQLIYFKDIKTSDTFCNIVAIFCQLSVLDVAQAAFQENLQFVARFEQIRKHISKRHEWLVKKYESVSSGLSENLPLKDSAKRLEALKALYSCYELL